MIRDDPNPLYTYYDENEKKNKGRKEKNSMQKSQESKIPLGIIAVFTFIMGIICVCASLRFTKVLFVFGAILMVIGAIITFYKAYRSDEFGGYITGGAMTLVTTIAVLAILLGSFVTVDTGERGVIVNSPDGEAIGTVIGEGWSFDTMYLMSNIDYIRINSQTIEYVGSDDADDTVGGITVLTSDNLTVDMDLAVTFHIPADYVGHMRMTYGPDWKLTVLHQEVRSVPRLVCAQYTALEIVGEDREYVEQAIKARLTESIETKGIIVDNVIIRELRIPNVLTEAVEQKLAAQQMLEKAQIDLQRIQVEAQASAEAVDKVRSQFNSDEAYLQYILYRTLGELDDVQVILTDNGTATVKVV